VSNLGQEPKLIQGGLATDDRGTLVFHNDFHFEGVKRFYVVTNHRQGFIRAWHGHRKEAKYVTVLQGSALLGAVRVTDWDKPSREEKPLRFVLSQQRPGVMYIPAGYANGFMTLTADAIVAFFSTSTLEESQGDDIRFESRYWNIWDIVER